MNYKVGDFVYIYVSHQAPEIGYLEEILNKNVYKYKIRIIKDNIFNDYAYKFSKDELVKITDKNIINKLNKILTFK